MPGVNEKRLSELMAGIEPVDLSARESCRRRWDELAKPLDGLGQFEEILVQLAGIQRSDVVQIRPRTVVVMCADHGVTVEQVAQTEDSVTASIAGAIAEGTSTVNVMAEAASADVLAVDIGMKKTVSVAGVLDMNVARGTGNLAQGPAMSREAACLAVLRGIETAERLAYRGYRILAAGEMGIGNTTSASAIMSVMSGMDASMVTGRGAGLPDHLYGHKIEVVRKAVSVNHPDRNDPLDVLSCLGGYELAGMVGLYLGGAMSGTAVVVDGFPSAVSALLAQELCPLSREYMIASHLGKEPASEKLMEMLSMKPVLHAGMALGEATGAVMLFPLLDVALALYEKGETFQQISLAPYERYQPS